MLLLFSFFLRETLSPTLLLQSKSVRHGADLLSHAILYWIEFRVFCFALSRIGIIYKNKKKETAGRSFYYYIFNTKAE